MRSKGQSLSAMGIVFAARCKLLPEMRELELPHAIAKCAADGAAAPSWKSIAVQM